MKRLLAAFPLIAAVAAAAVLLTPPEARAAREVIVNMPPGNVYRPAFVVIEPGDTVKWLHVDDRVPHTVTTMNNQPVSFDSSRNCPGDLLDDDCMYEDERNTFSYTFKKTGTYTVNYYCKVHGTPTGDPQAGTCGMCAQVKVTSGPPPKTATPTPSPTEAASPTSEPSPTPTTTGTESPNPTESPTASPSPDPTASPTEFAIDDTGSGGGGGGGRAALAVLAVGALAGVGWGVWRRMIAPGV